MTISKLNKIIPTNVESLNQYLEAIEVKGI